MEKDDLDELPIDSVIRFLEVELDHHKARACFLGFKAMDNFLENNLVLGYPSVGNKGRLGRGDELVKERPEFGDKNLRDNLVHNIAQANGREMINRCRISNLRYENN